MEKPRTRGRGRKFWGLVALVAWGVWVRTAYLRARAETEIRLLAAVCDETLVLRFDPPLGERPEARRDGVLVEPAPAPAGAGVGWLLGGLRPDRPERVEVRARGRSWVLPAVRASGPPATLGGVSARGRVLLDVHRPIEASWARSAAAPRSLEVGRHELELSEPERWPWVLRWRDRGLPGETRYDPAPMLRAWAGGVHARGRPARVRNHWRGDPPEWDALRGRTPLAALAPWRTAGLQALEDPREARPFWDHIEEWRALAWRSAPPGRSPEPCDRTPRGWPRRVGRRPAFEVMASVRAEESGVGVLGGIVDDQEFVVSEPPGRRWLLSPLSWPRHALPRSGRLALVIRVPVLQPPGWYRLRELRASRGYEVFFPPRTCGGAGDDPGHVEYLVWEVSAAHLPEPGAHLTLEVFVPDGAPRVSDWQEAWVGLLPPEVDLRSPADESGAGAGTGSRG